MHAASARASATPPTARTERSVMAAP
ncbi:hypothetical protein J2X26_003666 [Cellulomonas humilata]|uniref:Uncharacterized protein n=1 Tax=Cellulomonas humilata TaxID=144055 RepID=A0ABU0EJW0_9CELL|nr:hypothetical protein [Cellulomonas humilata]